MDTALLHEASNRPPKSDKAWRRRRGFAAAILSSAGLLGKQLAKTVMLCGGIPIITDIDYEKAETVADELNILTGCKSISM